MRINFHHTFNKAILFFLLLPGASFAQATPNQLLRSVYQKLMKVKDYSVDASIKADIPMVKILPVNAVIYFKQPDKIKVVSKNIAILPRQGFSDLAKLIGDSLSYTAFRIGGEVIAKTNTQIISLIPTVDTGDLVLAKFWIDADRKLILKSLLNTRTTGTVGIEYAYGSNVDFGLPDHLIFTADIKKFKMPKAMTADLNNSTPEPKENGKAEKKGIIDIRLTNYKINQGLKEEFFKK